MNTPCTLGLGSVVVPILGTLALACSSSSLSSTRDGGPDASSSSGSGGSGGSGSGSGSTSSSGSGSSGGGATDSGAACPLETTAAAHGIKDGCPQAPAGAPEYPDLLSDYGSSRPPWDVAGVEYRVGVADGTILRDPTAGALPSCATYDAASHIVTVTASDCTLDAFDFTRSGGLQLSIPSGISNTTVNNSLFGLSGNPGFSTAVLDRRGGSLTVQGCTFQGTGQNPMYFDTGASGTVIFEYNSFYDIDGDGMDFGSSQVVVVQYNACAKIGMKAAAHPDCVQFCGGALDPSSHESFNLSYQPVGVASTGAQGLQVSEQCGGTIDGYSADHNTVIAADANSLTMSYSIYNNGQNVSLEANYIDSSGAYGPFYPTGTASCSGNVALTNAHGFTAGQNITGAFGTMMCE